ncbi:hypothetical protein HMPREF9373_1272 [Psychrobacter sp. 1501(2011)]|nr:hypothetical protein HMPREF9373_1272 [Psychrobacter sp. 1501(2011)]
MHIKGLCYKKQLKQIKSEQIKILSYICILKWLKFANILAILG